MSSATVYGPGSRDDDGSFPLRTPLVSLSAHVAMVVVSLAAVHFAGPALGFALPVGALALLGAGALAVEALPRFATEIAVAVGVAMLVRLNSVYAAYHLVLVAVLFACRRRTWTLALALAVLAIAVPKTLFARHYHQQGFWNWLNEPSLASALFVAAYWWRERRDGRLPAETTPARWGLLFFFPMHAANPMVFGPGDLWRERRVVPGLVARGLVTFLVKAGTFAALQALFPGHGYAAQPAGALLAAPRASLWLLVLLNYLDLVLTLAGTADLAILVARLYGWNLPSPFRWALLAWNPVELWRRWGIYNRRFLLKTVYFPLGGNTRRRLLNVLLTFLASALVLHSGWFGSKYWEVGVGGWRDYSIYFLVQGAVVCACLLYWRVKGKNPASDRVVRLSWPRVGATLATQAMSALVHVIVLPQAIPLGDRWRVIGRCLGL